MKKQSIGGNISGAGGQPLPFSKAYRAGDFVFVSGQTAMGPKGELIQGGIVEQTRQVLENIKGVLAEAGCEMSDVVKTTVWLDDSRDFWSFNRVYSEYFPTDAPARSTVRAELVIDAKIEIEAIAYKPLA